ncbi:ATP-binding cassette domain-containing protein [Exiguobacterium sp. SH3S2]|uniref:ABC transporter ATP-binding protein n=1 Tax=unclassified Exiguobacterium TaxID=2644629 RepID=UPI00103DBA75|nr:MULTISPECIES: ABC transporter transmembrane domain-containing protein [unclassified Exiguobacterium]TCI26991.1 ATP-binding cassette domain-containing protein [Exiguobacterium sp. SH5S4]TCI42043.1 ATP-binding cassette domain-containing protein [Exiguobacterium sp. SH3S3]TCI50227.1 ATP-binding cassette domain-containing protein [Exiguobacterium sp. SH5S13]TCI58521.1 ATP-binding cassette domain-containing protein [Exiguobacterium sp. SH3S2]TCI61012.1 ATP-binding cassette domain-containing prot
MKLIKQLDWFIKRQKRTYVIAIILLIITGVIDMLPPWIIGQAIDAIREGSLTTERLITIVGSLLGIMVLSYVLSYLWIARLFGTAFLLEKKLRARFFGYLLKQTPRFYQQHRTGDLMALATNDLKAVERTAGFGVMTLVDSFNMTLIALTIMGVFIDWKLTLAALLPMPLLAWSMNKLGRQIHARFTAAQDSFGVMNDQVVESISGLRVIRSFVQEEADTKKFDTITDDVMAKNMHVAKIDVLFEPVIKLLVGLSYLIGLSFGTYLVFTNDITLGQLVSFNIYLGMLIWPMYAFGELINVVQRGTASLERIEATMNEAPDVVSNGTVQVDVPEKITFKSLSFRYPGASRPSLEDIVLHVSRGETIGIVGPTGAGKTTLLRQLIREYPIDDSLLVNGIPVHQIKLDTVRGWSGYVSQEHLLFSKTVRDNILFGADDATEADLETAIRLAAFDTDIEHLENGLDTVVGEQGVMLSGGQKQRLSIARALLKDPEILLLDDSLSAVDAKTEARIIDSVRTSRAEQTTFIVAHRLSAVSHADQILVLQDGRVTERGTHDQLMKQHGWYFEQFNRQGETE